MTDVLTDAMCVIKDSQPGVWRMGSVRSAGRKRTRRGESFWKEFLVYYAALVTVIPCQR